MRDWMKIIERLDEARIVPGVGGKRPLRRQVFGYHATVEGNPRLGTTRPLYTTSVRKAEDWPDIVSAADDDAKWHVAGLDLVIIPDEDGSGGVLYVLAWNKAEADAAVKAWRLEWLKESGPRPGWFGTVK